HRLQSTKRTTQTSELMQERTLACKQMATSDKQAGMSKLMMNQKFISRFHSQKSLFIQVRIMETIQVSRLKSVSIKMAIIKKHYLTPLKSLNIYSKNILQLNVSSSIIIGVRKTVHVS